MADTDVTVHNGPIKLAAEPKRWQVKFKSGQGQQVTHPAEGDVRAWAAATYGEDYEIESVTELI